MATVKYFATCNGKPVELSRVAHSGAVSTKPREFSGLCPACGGQHAAERKVEYKAFPLLHQCGPRCTNARGFLCECSCGGKNHGRGQFACA